MIKVVAANVVMDVLDRAIQVHGSLGMSDDTPLAGMWRFSRMLKVADGPDEVHKMVIARRELNRRAKLAEAGATAPTRQRRREGAASLLVEPVDGGLVGRLGEPSTTLANWASTLVGLAVLARRVARERRPRG